MIIRKFSFSDNKKISCQVSDKTNNFEWIAYEQDVDGICFLQKQGAFDPSQIYYSLERTVENINKLFIDSVNIYTAYDDTTLLGEIISTTNPLTSTIEISIPGGINEKAVDVVAQSGNLYFLTPGIATGENAKIIKYDTNGNLDQVIDLIKTGDIVYNALSFTIDINDDIWIATNESPSNLIRIYDTGGNIWDFQVTPII